MTDGNTYQYDNPSEDSVVVVDAHGGLHFHSIDNLLADINEILLKVLALESIVNKIADKIGIEED